MFKCNSKSFVSKNESLRLFSFSSTSSVLNSTTHPEFHQPLLSRSCPPVTDPSNSDLLHSFDPKIYVSALINCRNLPQIKQVHTQVVVNGMLKNLTVINKLIYMYSLYKTLNYAHALFDGMKERDPVSWSVMVGGFTKAGDYMNCFDTFRQLIRFGSPLDNYTLPFVIRACRDTMNSQLGRTLHQICCKYGFDSDQFVSASLVDMYARCKMIYCAQNLFDQLPKRDLITWTVMIGAYAECGNPNVSLDFFNCMIEDGISPDKITLVTVVNACAKLGAMHKARFVHDYFRRRNFSLCVILGSAMIDMYAKCGSINSAREIFDQMKEKNVITWSAMIAAYGYHGQGKRALDLFPLMLSSGLAPNRITFTSLLYACSHSGLVEEGVKIFTLVKEPDVKHYTCVIDLLGRAGRFKEAFELIDKMEVEKDEGLWCALLGACRIHGRIELAEKAAESLLELNPQNPGHYVLLSNIYANVGKWEKVAKIRALMTHNNLKKIPGWTWIEVNNGIHQFSVGDRSHRDSEEIYEKLKSLILKLELAGYVPDTNFVLHDVDEELKREVLYSHSEKLAIAFGLLSTREDTCIRIRKNLRVCGDCHTFSKWVSSVEKRVIILRDANRFHHFESGVCSCRDYW